jgi:hypothetical protein
VATLTLALLLALAQSMPAAPVTSTLLTLVVVPVVYTYLDDLKPETVRAWFRRRRTRRAADEAGGFDGIPARD